jgi:exodeoxyribonuclease V
MTVSNTTTMTNLEITHHNLLQVAGNKESFVPTTCQVNAMNQIQPWLAEDKLSVFVLTGTAGTGKTTIIKQVIQQAVKLGYSVLIACPTGRAARRAKKQSGHSAQTVHSLVYTITTVKGKATIVSKQKIDLDGNKTLFIFDEAGMVEGEAKDNSNELFQTPKALLDAIAIYCKSGHSQNKVMFVGDTYQQAPQKELYSRALCSKTLSQKFSTKISEAHLHEVKRTAENSELLTLSTELKNRPFFETATWLRFSHNPITALPNVYQKYIDACMQYGADEVIAICASTDNVNLFNKELRNVLFGNDCLALEPNDKLRIVRNYDKQGTSQCNGDIATLESVDWDSIENVEIKIKDKPFITNYVTATLSIYDANNNKITITEKILLNTLLTGKSQLANAVEHAMCHQANYKNKVYRETGNYNDDKYLSAIRVVYDYAQNGVIAQGNEWEVVFVNNAQVPNYRWLYTAVTRAKTLLHTFNLNNKLYQPQIVSAGLPTIDLNKSLAF